MDDSTKDATETKSEPKVEIFGEGVGSKHKDRERFHYHLHCNHHHGSFAWGLALILIGFLFLLSNFGVLSPIVWGQVVHLWPVLIILIGLDVLMGHSEVSDVINSIIGLFVLATILGIIFIHTSPQIINGLPHNIQNYLYSVNNYLQIK
jgi:hypothetical protein